MWINATKFPVVETMRQANPDDRLPGLKWGSVVIPPVLPKPELVPLTGGYRRAPVLQIGADVYCDTRLILRELERGYPQPALFHPRLVGFANAVSAWAEGPLFRSVMLYAWGTNHDLMPAELFEYRARMRGLPQPSIVSVERAAARNAPLVRVQLSSIEDMFADGRRWICGEAFSEADLSVFHAVWFLTNRSSRLAHELDRFSQLQDWMSRVREIGHGQHRTLAATEALATAKEAKPAPPRSSEAQPEDPEIGSDVQIRAADYAQDPITGKLDFVQSDEICVRIINDRVGEVAVHFPRIGFDMRPARLP